MFNLIMLLYANIEVAIKIQKTITYISPKRLFNIQISKTMTKSEIIESIVATTGIEKSAVSATVEALMGTIKEAMTKGENIYLRGFGTFQLKTRAEKTGRNIAKGTTVKIPAHVIPAFKPAKEFVGAIKTKVLAR
jgi:DNA-binding protein HU-beta